MARRRKAAGKIAGKMSDPADRVAGSCGSNSTATSRHSPGRWGFLIAQLGKSSAEPGARAAASPSHRWPAADQSCVAPGRRGTAPACRARRIAPGWLARADHETAAARTTCRTPRPAERRVHPRRGDDLQRGQVLVRGPRVGSRGQVQPRKNHQGRPAPDRDRQEVVGKYSGTRPRPVCCPASRFITAAGPLDARRVG